MAVADSRSEVPPLLSSLLGLTTRNEMDAPREDLATEIDLALRSTTKRNVVALLQAVQQRLGYLPLEALQAIADQQEVSPATVFGVATFYNQFRFVPPGKRHVRVCMGTACHIKGSQAILDEWQRQLGIADGQVTEDRSYSLETVACVGCCALAPVTVVGAEVHGHVTPATVDDLLLRHQIADDQGQS